MKKIVVKRRTLAGGSTLKGVSPELRAAFRSAIDYYGFKSVNAFFYASAISLVEQHKRGDMLLAPLRFEHNGTN
jgi:hypothetical protein